VLRVTDLGDAAAGQHVHPLLLQLVRVEDEGLLAGRDAEHVHAGAAQAHEPAQLMKYTLTLLGIAVLLGFSNGADAAEQRVDVGKFNAQGDLTLDVARFQKNSPTGCRSQNSRRRFPMASTFLPARVTAQRARVVRKPCNS
jgi:hypothetical protein